MAAGIALAVNIVLAILKIATGILGNSYALVADGIESTTDIVSSLVVWTGLRISALPADDDHPYGHGKAESIAGVLVALALLAAAAFIAFQSVREILTPHHAPEWYTLVVLALVILVKETLFRFVLRVGQELSSTALHGDAWHHRSDALTSAAAFLGITVALVGGPGFESADDWAALLGCTVIAFNGIRLFRTALGEIMDAAVPDPLQQQIRAAAANAPGVVAIEKCRIRKSGLGLLVEIHVEVNGDLTVRRGHEIGHEVGDRLKATPLSVQHVMVHIEPAPECPSPLPPDPSTSTLSATPPAPPTPLPR